MFGRVMVCKASGLLGGVGWAGVEGIGMVGSGAGGANHIFASIFAQVSLSVTVRLKTSLSGVESGSTQK